MLPYKPLREMTEQEKKEEMTKRKFIRNGTPKMFWSSADKGTYKRGMEAEPVKGNH